MFGNVVIQVKVIYMYVWSYFREQLKGLILGFIESLHSLHHMSFIAFIYRARLWRNIVFIYSG